MSTQIVKDVEARLLSLVRKSGKVPRYLPQDYYSLGETGLTCFNLKTPQVRALAKELFLDLKAQNFDSSKQFKIAQELWLKGQIFETMAIALFWLESQETIWLVENSAQIIKWVERINNWAHSDTYSGVLAKIFEAEPKKLKHVFQAWNKHRNPWKRRNSIVGLMLYSRMRKSHPSFSFCLQLVDSQKAAPEYYVQKAYGWTLREMYNVYPEDTLRYLKQNAKMIPPAGWYAATEKLKRSEKLTLLKIRKS